EGGGGRFTPRERRRAMAAAVFQRGGLAAAVAEQHHLLVEKGSPDRARLQIIRPDRGVPAIAQEHEQPPTVTSNEACRPSFDARRNVRADLLSTAAARSWSPAFFPGRRECKSVIEPGEALEGVRFASFAEHLPVHFASDAVRMVDVPHVAGFERDARGAQQAGAFVAPEGRFVVAICGG